MTTFSDIFKKSFLQETGNLTTEGFVMSMLAAFLCGMIIYFIYRYFYRGVIYNNNFNILLVLVSVVTCFVVIVISSNVLLSLGMVGALSIIRFRTVVKDPLDVGFLFFAIAAGITAGAGLYIISFVGTLFVSVVYVLLVRIRTRKKVYLLIVKYQDKAASDVAGKLEKIHKTLKNRTSTKNYTEITYEVHLHKDNTVLTAELANTDGVESAIIVEFTGDYCE